MALPRPDGQQFTAEDTISRPTPPDPAKMKEAGKANIVEMRKKLAAGESVEAVDPDDNDWRYKKNPDGSIEIISAPNANKRAEGMVIKPGQKFYDAIDMGIFGATDAPEGRRDQDPFKTGALPVGDSETAPVLDMPNIEGVTRTDAVTDSNVRKDFDGAPEDKIVEGRNIRKIADRLGKRLSLRDSE